MTAAPALWIAMPAVAVWAEPPAMPASGRSEVPDLNSTWSSVEPETVGRDLRERGPGALAHVVGAGLHHARAVAAQHRARLGLEHQRRKGRGAHAPADQHAGLVAHLPRRQRALRPAEAFGALRVAFAQAFEENGLPEIGSTSA